jgi:hypothetical protein
MRIVAGQAMDNPFPINRVAHYFAHWTDADWSQVILAEFTDRAVQFTKDFADHGPTDKSVLARVTDRLVELAIREAIDEGASQVRFVLGATDVAVLYLHADGRVQDRDAVPRRIFRTLVESIKLRCDERQEFVVDDQTAVCAQFESGEGGEAVTLTIRHTAPGH